MPTAMRYAHIVGGQGSSALCARVDLISQKPAAPLQRWQHAGENLEPQILFVAQAVGAALDHPDLIVEPLDKAERDLVLRLAVGGDPVPVTIDHFGELLIGLEPLPLEALSPVLKETPRPALTLVTPQLAKTLLEDIGRVEPLVGRKQRLQCLLAVER